MARTLGLVALVVIAAAIGRVTADSAAPAPLPVSSARTCPQPPRVASLGSIAVDGVVDDIAVDEDTRPRFELAGIVVDGITQAPVPHAIVRTHTDVAVEADGAGRFRFAGLMPGRYTLTAHGDHRYGESAGTINLANHAIDDVVVTMFSAYRVEVRLVDGSTGQPCSGGSVTVSDDTTSMDLRETPDHRYVNAGMPPARYTVRATCDGLLDSDETTLLVDTEDVELTLELEPAVPIAGVVVDAYGAAVEAVQVQAWRPDQFTPGCDFDDDVNGHGVTTDDDGTFSLTTLEPGPYHVGVKRGVTVACVDVTAPAASVRLVLDDSASLRGSVRVGGQAPTRYKIDLVSRGEVVDEGSYYRSGAYAFRSISPGHYALVFSMGHITHVVEVDIAGDRVLNIDLPAPATVRGRIRYADGSVPELVSLVRPRAPGNWWPEDGVAVSDGHFEIVDLPVGRWELSDLETMQRVVLDVLHAGRVDVGELVIPAPPDDELLRIFDRPDVAPSPE